MIDRAQSVNRQSSIVNSSRRVALKVDCDTYVGTRDGVPRLLEIFAARNIRATFFFSYGPDRSGVAVRRVFTKRGFLRKMLRSRAVSLYGFPTILYGTFLAAPMIGERCAGQIRAAARAGHETGVHGWDHVGWHDHVDRWTIEKIREEYGRAHEEHARIVGQPARASAAPGWAANARSLAVEEERSLLYTSNTRGGSPFFPSAEGRVFRTLEIPSTLPTLDETLAWGELENDAGQRRYFRQAVRGTEVHTIHVEVEGRSMLPLFGRILDDWIADGVTFVPLEDLAREAHADGTRLPTRELTRPRLPGRGGEVATGWPATREG
ncbi:MAG TPA: polysaccharide deacetylase family protein [Thermoanaerobaculia bacterium]|nr:polysaccharide deacetylase family protein [Thermoanaerobaculia bacterium]